MLDLFTTDQQDAQSPRSGALAAQVAPSAAQAFSSAWEANTRLNSLDAAADNQRDFMRQRALEFTARTGVALPSEVSTGSDPSGGVAFDTSYSDWLSSTRDAMQRVSKERNDPTLAPPTDDEIAAGGIELARSAVRRQAALGAGPVTLGSIGGSAAAGAAASAIDPLNTISLAVAPEGGPLLAAALRMGGAMAAQSLIGDVSRYGYRQQVDPDYGVGDLAKDVAGSFVGGAAFGAGHALGGEGVKAALGAAAGGAAVGGAIGGMQNGTPGALEGAIGGASLPLAGAAFGASARALGMSWRAFKAASPEAALAMPLDIRDAGEVAEKAGDIQAQNPFRGASGDAAHADAIASTEKALLNGAPFQLPASVEGEAAVRRGQVFFPGGSIDVRYGVAEHGDLVTSHDADFNIRPDYPPEMQPRDRGGAPAQDQVNSIAANLQPDRLGPSPEANAGAPIVGPDGVVESGNGRAMALGRAYDLGRGDAYRQWLEQQGYDTTGFERPVLVGMRETAMDPMQRADFAHAANGSASLRMSAAEQALSDARLLDRGTLDLARSPDLAAAANRDFARAVVSKLPAGERGGLLTRDGGLSANGARRMQAALTARAYGDAGLLARGFDHPDPNIKAIAGALTDAAGPWARMRDAATSGDIAPGHDITRDVLDAVHSIMRARDEGRPLWEVLNQGDMFKSDTTQLASRMFFRDEAMRQPAGRARVAEALKTYATEALKNTSRGRLFDDAVTPIDVLRHASRGLQRDALDLLSRGLESSPSGAAETAQRARLPEEIVDAVDRAAAQDGGGDASGEGARDGRSGGEGQAFDDGGRQSPARADGGQWSTSGSSGAADPDRSTRQSAARRIAARNLAQLARSATTAPEAIAGALDQAAKDVLAMARRKPTSDQFGFDFSTPDRNPLIPSAEQPSAVPRSVFQTRMHALADQLDEISQREIFGDMPSGVHRDAYERHREMMQAVKTIAKGLDGIMTEIARVSGAEDIGADASIWPAIRDGLHEDIRRLAADMRAEMRDPDRIAPDEERPHIDIRPMAAEIADEVRASADDNAWIARDASEDHILHEDDLDALAIHAAGIAARFDDLFNEIQTSVEARYDRSGEEHDLYRYERNPAQSALTLPDELRAAATELRQDQAGDLAPRQAPLRPRLETAVSDDRLTMRNPRTGEVVRAQATVRLRDMLGRFDPSLDAAQDPLLRASSLAIGSRLGKLVGDMPVFTVGPAEMRALAEGRMTMQPGFEPAGFFDPSAGHIVALDDALRDRREAASLMLHEGLHGAFMRTINASDAARSLVDDLRATALAEHLDRGGAAADHYGLSNAHEFVSEGFSNPEFQRFLASIPADDRLVKAFGLDDAPGFSLWDVFVAAVRKILGLAPDQHTLLDATMRIGQILEDHRADLLRGAKDDLAPMLRMEEPSARADAAQAAAERARAFADAKDAISYRINTDRIQQHPNGPLAGFLGILTRDIHEKGGINVEAVQQDYEGRMAAASEKILEPYGSKWAGLKQDVAGIRDVIREVFGVDTKNETARTAAEAWKSSIDGFATAEAKRLGKVFTPAEDWRVPQFWESSRAQKFGKATLLADMEREIAAGGLKVFDPDTHEEANPIRARMILDEAADRIVTDASLGGTPGASGSFRTDMRVFRFTDGAAGADAYLRMMDKYGAGRGGYLQMMQAHVGKVSRELGLARVLGPGWANVGERLLQDALLADRKAKANLPARDLSQRLRDLPKDTGRFLTSWLESPAKAEAVWQHMSGQASGVGSELMAGLLSETRAFMTSTRMGSALVTAVPADAVNWLMAAKHNGMDMGRMVSAITDAFLKDNPERREEAARLGIVAHAGTDAAIGTKRFEDQFVGDKVMKRLADFVIRAQGLHAWDSAIKRAFPMEFLGTIAQRAGKALEDLDEPFANFLRRFGLDGDWSHLSNPDHMLDTGEAKFLHPDRLPEPLRVKLMSAIYDERQFAYLAGGTERVRAVSAQAKAGTLPGELARSVFLFKSFPMTMLATWGMRSAREAGAGRIGTLATLVTGMTMAGALAMQARALLQGKDPRSMRDPYFWAESFLQGGAAGIYGDFFKEAFSRSDTSLTETMMGPLAAIPAGIQGLTSGARRAAEDGERVNFGAKVARLLSQNTPGGNLWYGRLVASRLIFDNVQRMIDRDYAGSFARQQQRALKTSHQGFWWAPGQNAPVRGMNFSAT